MARPLGNDLRIGIGNIRVGLNRQVTERNDSPDKEHDCHTQHQDAVAQGKVDEIPNHLPCSATAEENSSALATISSPPLTPSWIGCMPSAIPPNVRTSTRCKRCGPSFRN